MKRRKFIKMLLSIPFVGYVANIFGETTTEFSPMTDFTTNIGGWCKLVRDGDVDSCYTSSDSLNTPYNEIIWERQS